MLKKEKNRDVENAAFISLEVSFFCSFSKMATQPNNYYTNQDDKLDKFIELQKKNTEADRRDFVNLSNNVDALRNRLSIMEREKVSFESLQSYVNLVAGGKKKATRNAESDISEEEEDESKASWQKRHEVRYKKLKNKVKELDDIHSRIIDLEDHKERVNNRESTRSDDNLIRSIRFDNFENDLERHEKDIQQLKTNLKRKGDHPSEPIEDQSSEKKKRIRLEKEIKGMKKTQQRLIENNAALTDLTLQMSRALASALGNKDNSDPFLTKITAIIKQQKH